MRFMKQNTRRMTAILLLVSMLLVVIPLAAIPFASAEDGANVVSAADSTPDNNTPQHSSLKKAVASNTDINTTAVSDGDLLPEVSPSDIMPLAEIIASGTCGECSWTIDADGVLTIFPTDGESGTLANGDPMNSSVWSWNGYRNRIKSAIVMPGVIGNKSVSNMFDNLYGSTSIDVSGLDTSNVTDMSYMFNYLPNCTSIDVSCLDTSNVTDMSYMFSLCSSLTELDVSGFDTSNVTDMSGIFSDCSSLTELDVSGFDTSNVTDIDAMFGYCSSLTELDVSGFDTSNVTSMTYMFTDCSSLTELDVSGFDTSNVTSMSIMFADCSSLTELDVSGFDTSKVTGMHAMFGYCSSLTELDVSGFDTSKVTGMSYMFEGCSSLRKLDVSGFDTSATTDYVADDLIDDTEFYFPGMQNIFNNCGNLVEIEVGTGWKPIESYSMDVSVNAFNVIDGTLYYQPTEGYVVGSVTIHDNGSNAPVDLSAYPDSYPNFTGNKTATIIFVKESDIYDVSYNANGGTGTMNTQSMIKGNPMALTANAFTRDGYIFLGWNTDRNAQTALYTNKQEVIDIFEGDAPADVTLYAIWVEDEFVVGDTTGKDIVVEAKPDDKLGCVDKDGNLIDVGRLKLIVGNVADNQKKTVLDAVEKYNRYFKAEQNNHAMYDISLVDKISGAKVDVTDGRIKITLKIPDNFPGNSKKYTFKLYHYKDDGTVEEIPITLDSGKSHYSFYADDFSPFVITWTEKPSGGSSPSTGDPMANNNAMLAFVVNIVMLSLMVILLGYKMRGKVPDTGTEFSVAEVFSEELVEFEKSITEDHE